MPGDITFADGEVYTTAELNGYIYHQTVPKVTSTTQPSSPATGMSIYETDDDQKRLYTGSAWTEIANMGPLTYGWKTHTSSWTSSGTAPAIGNGSAWMNYQRLYGRTFFIKGRLVIGSSSTFGTGTFRLSLPSAVGSTARASEGKGLLRANSNVYICTVNCASGATYVTFKTHNVVGATADLVDVTGTSPEAWVAANAGIIQFGLVVEGNTDS